MADNIQQKACSSDNVEDDSETTVTCQNENVVPNTDNNINGFETLAQNNMEENAHAITAQNNMDEEDGNVAQNYMDEDNVVTAQNNIDEEILQVDGDSVHEEEAPVVDNTNDSLTTEDEKDDKHEPKTVWTHDELQNLLIKAINYKSPLRDVRTVLRAGANVNQPFNNGLMPLHYAAYIDNAACVDLLLQYGANVNSTDEIGYTPLHLSARRGNYSTMKALIENGAIININEPGTVIHNTGEKTKLGVATVEPINLAIQNCHADCVELLLLKGARPDNVYFMGQEVCLAPLDEPECLELLLKYGASPNEFNRCGLTPLMKACKDHHIEAMRILLKYDADVNIQCPPLFEQKTALHFAILSGNIVIVNILLSRGAKVNRLGDYNYSALHLAVIKGRLDIVRVLLQYGAEVDEQTEEGATALMLACCTTRMNERQEIVQMLVTSGADVNAHAEYYSYHDPYLSPLAEYFKNIEDKENFNIVELLVKNGATVHFTSNDFDQRRLRDPFSILPHCGCLNNHQNIFQLLLTAAKKFSPLGIHASENVPVGLKDELLFVATRPRDLKQQTRNRIFESLGRGIPDKIRELPLPSILRAYLEYE